MPLTLHTFSGCNKADSKMTKQAFAYYRTSSATNVSAKDKDGDKPKKKGLSEDKDSRVRQELAVRAYADTNDIEIVGEFYDAAVSGADMIHTRPGFENMLKAILGNGVHTILVETANRFARDLIVQETGYQYLKARGVDIIAVDSPTSFLDDTPTATLIRQVLGAVAQFEKSALVARLAGGRKRTGRTGGKAPLAVTQPAMIDRVHQLRASDPEITLRAIGEVLTAEGHLTSKGKPFNPAQIARIIASKRSQAGMVRPE
jgi:DNA invertase Pin-like site-specific DNA recombinase